MKRDLSTPLSISVFNKNGNGKKKKVNKGEVFNEGYGEMGPTNKKMASSMCKKGMDAYDSFIKKGKTPQQANKLASKLCK